MARLAVNYIVPMPIGKCVARLRNYSIQLSKQVEQQRRDRESYSIEIILDGKDLYNIQMSKDVGPFISARLDGYLKKIDKNRTLVTATTRIGRFTKVLEAFIAIVISFYVLAGVETALSSRWLGFIIITLAIGFGPLFAAYRLKQDLVKLLQTYLLTGEREL